MIATQPRTTPVQRSLFDPLRCTPDQQRLAMSAWRLAHRAAHRYRETLGDDALGVALLHLTRAAIDYDESLGFRFTTLAVRYMLTGLSHEVAARRAKARGGTTLTVTYPTTDEGDTWEPADSRDYQEEIERRLDVRRLLRLTHGEYRRALRMRYLREWSYERIGEKLGVSKGTARKYVVAGIDEINRGLWKRKARRIRKAVQS